MTRVCILYATISGSTERFANLLGELINLEPSEVINIMTVDPKIVDSYDTIIVCSPTYGKGDLHYLWRTWIEQDCFSGKQIALVVLGNSRSHKSSFAGAQDHFVADLDWSKNKLIIVEGERALILDMANRRSLRRKCIVEWSKSFISLISQASLVKLVSTV